MRARPSTGSTDSQPASGGILELVRESDARARRSLNLVASENQMSPDAREALASDLNHRYLLPRDKPDDVWDYPNQELGREIERRASELACALFDGDVADLRPLSGTNACAAVLTALASRGETVLSVPADCGGHFATARICAHGGLVREDLPFDRSTGRVDLDAFSRLVARTRPSLVLIDASMILFAQPLREMRERLGPEPILSYDASHTFGLIGGGQLQRPLLEGADLVHGSTHKSLFGPQKGMIVSRRRRDVPARIRDAVAPLYVSNPHPHHVAALGIALEELRTYGADYARAVVRNARRLAAGLEASGMSVLFAERGYTETHQVFVRLAGRAEARAALHALEVVGIHANAVALPFVGGFGLRLGMAEMTRRGIEPSAVDEVAHVISSAIAGRDTRERLRARALGIAEAYRTLAFHAGAQRISRNAGAAAAHAMPEAG